MTYPSGFTGVVDLMMGTRAGEAAKGQYKFMEKALRDTGSKEMNFPAQYMFKDVPFSDQARDPGAPLEAEPPRVPSSSCRRWTSTASRRR